MSIVSSAFDGLEIGPAGTAANLAMFPLLRPDGPEREPAYWMLDEALAEGWARVSEVSESGSVPTLRVLNNGSRPVLILDGEELVGAKQNRTVNLSILVAARSTLDIPVTCVEAGRWHFRGRHFEAARRLHYASARAAKAQQVTACLMDAGLRHADQSWVWDDISAKSARMGAFSATGAMAAMFEQSEKDLDEVATRLVPVHGQVGAVFTINGVVAGLDLFDAPATFRKFLPKLAQSYGLDAMDRSTDRAVQAKSDVRRFVAGVAKAPWKAFKAIGLGNDLRLDGAELAGGALAADRRVVHLAAFMTGESEGPARRRRPRPPVVD